MRNVGENENENEDEVDLKGGKLIICLLKNTVLSLECELFQKRKSNIIHCQFSRSLTAVLKSVTKMSLFYYLHFFL
jgi:hypothetical protein